MGLKSLRCLSLSFLLMHETKVSLFLSSFNVGLLSLLVWQVRVKIFQINSFYNKGKKLFTRFVLKRTWAKWLQPIHFYWSMLRQSSVAVGVQTHNCLNRQPGKSTSANAGASPTSVSKKGLPRTKVKCRPLHRAIFTTEFYLNLFRMKHSLIAAISNERSHFRFKIAPEFVFFLFKIDSGWNRGSADSWKPPFFLKLANYSSLRH